MLKKLAFFSPFKPIKSGISQYSEKLIKELKSFFDITIITDGYEPELESNVSSGIKSKDFQKIENISDFLKDFDEVLYHMGNSTVHKYIYDTLKKHPGVVVMHDYAIHDMIIQTTLIQGDFDSYQKEITACGIEFEGEPEVPLSLNFEPIKFMWEEKPLEYPLNEQIITSSKGIISHSHFIKDLLRKKAKFPAIKVIPMLTDEYQDYKKAEDKLIIGCFGIVAQNKRIHQIVKAISELKSSLSENFELQIVGEFSDEDYKKEIETLILEENLQDEVILKGFVDDKQFKKLLSQTDICLNLRYPTLGETSISLMQMLSLSKPCIISDCGWYAELPDEAVIKVSTPEIDEDKELEEIKKALSKLIKNEEEREKLAKAGRKYAEDVCNVKKVAEKYSNFIKHVKSLEDAKEVLAKKIIESCQEFGIDNEKHPSVIKLLAKNASDLI